MRFKRELLSATSVMALVLLCQPARADVVGTIVGAYDSQCGACGQLGGALTTYVTNGGGSPQGYDTPSLYFENTGTTAWTNITITLTGYQDAADGGTGTALSSPGPAITQTLMLPNIAPGELYQLIWNGPNTGSGGSIAGGSIGAPSGSPTSLDLFAYDYDDALGGKVGAVTDSLGHTCGSGSGTITSLCAYVGNMDVKFSALLGGDPTKPIAANFSPDNTQGGGNVAGKFVGWEGLDADGFSETSADAHSLTFPGTLAIITTGTAGTQNVPEPGTLALFGGGLGLVGWLRRRRKQIKA